ncbi:MULTISPECIES: TetR/AcrR family transcriptional regulator [unclassified Rathayibacter]|uniref:TetR/AcrR family transcriptional regulator n=1 Tax=unclassified Rathayibacter TaxID=2609250 RepID=UPI000CE8CD8E|nr:MULTISPECIES: TetR/AcrR family transcriptional regulator [unclassified Rathayibacter]PPF26148.1 TetR family transcriptional regulator [Rathayibacter sp. AY1F2]PPG19868.1 TetR family transcriptional regulator [Rathayibacter sp. AY1E8]PPH42040.1 TetR family transcriptional regulator [Rathayibacter sp. AY1F7]PPH98553.1 TetR family transcriptional regulator [Rathayibacter sp. AY1D1]
MASPSSRSTAEAQRERITAAALHVFARTGYAATPITEVAAEAGVSPAYVFRLFPGKLGVFVAAVDRCYEQVASTLAAAGEASPSSDPADRLEAMTVAYIDLIADRDLIMLQSQAQSACEVPEIREAVRRGISAVVRTVTVVSGADGPAVQRFVAYGQLCHLIVQTDLGGVDSEWARIVSDGIRHRD